MERLECKKRRMDTEGRSISKNNKYKLGRNGGNGQRKTQKENQRV